MVYFVLKLTLSAFLIFAVSELAKRSALFGGIIASIPLVSVLAMIWLYEETKSTQPVANLAHAIFWMVIPSQVLFIVLPLLLQKQIPFYLALALSIVMTVAGYSLMNLALLKFGIKL
ncbi:MAG: DUF3147 family protein [Candidatus Melainabacteria bacterium]|nr:DUF3147 family protein [Candidatus Melainabacteria bacterium]